MYHGFTCIRAAIYGTPYSRGLIYSQRYPVLVHRYPISNVRNHCHDARVCIYLYLHRPLVVRDQLQSDAADGEFHELLRKHYPKRMLLHLPAHLTVSLRLLVRRLQRSTVPLVILFVPLHPHASTRTHTHLDKICLIEMLLRYTKCIQHHVFSSAPSSRPSQSALDHRKRHHLPRSIQDGNVLEMIHCIYNIGVC